MYMNESKSKNPFAHPIPLDATQKEKVVSKKKKEMGRAAIKPGAKKRKENDGEKNVVKRMKIGAS
jgi:hypothetical protein